jgi:hypothetical protein
MRVSEPAIDAQILIVFNAKCFVTVLPPHCFVRNAAKMHL